MKSGSLINQGWVPVLKAIEQHNAPCPGGAHGGARSGERAVWNLALWKLTCPGKSMAATSDFFILITGECWKLLLFINSGQSMAVAEDRAELLGFPGVSVWWLSHTSKLAGFNGLAKGFHFPRLPSLLLSFPFPSFSPSLLFGVRITPYTCWANTTLSYSPAPGRDSLYILFTLWWLISLRALRDIYWFTSMFWVPSLYWESYGRLRV